MSIMMGLEVRTGSSLRLPCPVTNASCGFDGLSVNQLLYIHVQVPGKDTVVSLQQ